MSRCYLDSGALIKLYVVEPGSEAVQAALRDEASLSLNSLQETEVRTAIQAAAGRGLLAGAAADQALAFLDEDIRVGRWTWQEPDWEQVWTVTRQLSLRHARETLCRTLDLLHLALAREGNAEVFITGDRRQAEVSRRIGLPLIWID